MDQDRPHILPHDKNVMELALQEPWADRDIDRAELFRIAREFDMERHRQDLLTRLGDKPVDKEQVYRHILNQLSDRWERYLNNKYEGIKSFFLLVQFLEEVLPQHDRPTETKPV
jgi:hypothetical protein